MSPQLSVIVPVYRAEKTLDRCVKSILDQSFSDLELLLVDDGSPDRSGALADAWAARDPRVRVLHQKNGGASAARNAGLDAARGQFLSFVDADDWLLPGLYSAALPALERERLDLWLFTMRRQSDGGVELPQPGLYPALSALRPQLSALFITTGLMASPCNKLYRAARVGALRFDPALRVNEDVLFNLRYLAVCGPLRMVTDCYYAQDDTEEGSLSRAPRTDLLDAEAATRPAFAAVLAAAGCPQPEAEALLTARRVRSGVLQFGLATGRMPGLQLAERRAVLARVLADLDTRRAIRAQLAADPHRLPALPLRLCCALRWPGVLAALCAFKNKLVG